MIKVRLSKERGYEDKGWLQTHHTFSFDSYYDPDFMGYRTLRVLNEDVVKEGKGFGTHSHRDMEIITYVLEGALEHRDSIGTTTLISQGEVQKMSAGTGIQHSEYNPSHQQETHFLQIWIQPNQYGLTPSYSQKHFSTASKWGHWCLMVSMTGREGSLPIHQDVDIYSSLIDSGEEIGFEALPDRYYWLQVISGRFTVLGETLHAGDGAHIEGVSNVTVNALEGGEVLLIDLA